MTALAEQRLAARDRARDAIALLRDRQPPRVRPSLQQLYITAISIAIYGILAGHAISSAVGPGLEPRPISTFGPAVMVLGLLAALRFGCWQGPVVFSAPDVAILLSAPVAVADLVRPRLSAALVIATAAGAIAGGVLLLVLAGGPAGIGAARSVAGVVSLAAVAALATAAAWLVQSSRGLARAVLALSPLAALAAVGLLLVSDAGAAGRTVARWSGPWGWVTAPFTGATGWPAAVALLVLAAIVLAALAIRRAGASSAEQFLARAEARAGLIASVTMLDYRAAGVTYRAALSRTATRAPRRVRRPRSRRLLLLWRDLLALIRNPTRVAWAGLVCAGGSWEVISHPGRVPAAIIGAVALYLAASLLSEPLRVDVDSPETSKLLLSWPFTRVLAAHAVLPIIVLSVVACATMASAVIAGTAAAGSLALIPALIVPIVAGAVLCASFGTLRGGRVDNSTLLSILGTDPSSPVGALGVVIFLIPWLLLDIAVYGAVLVLVGHAAAHAHAHASVARAALGAAIAVGVLIALSARARSAVPKRDEQD